MTLGQHYKYFALWKNACVAQGWTTANGWTTKQKEAKRKQIHAVLDAELRSLNPQPSTKNHLSGFPLSSKQIHSEEQFDAIKARFLALADNVDGAVESDHPEIGRGRRLRNAFEDYFKCLVVYLGGEDSAQRYFDPILRDKFPKLRSVAEDQTVLSLLDLLSPEPPKPYLRKGNLYYPPSELDQAVATISGRVQTYRHLSGDSLHDMRMKAKIKCTCGQCAGARPPRPERNKETSNVPF